MATRTRPLPTAANPSDGLRGQGLRLVRRVMEAVLLVLVCASPWAFGAVEPLGEFLLLAGVGLLAMLWAAAMLLEGLLCWRKCPVAPLLPRFIYLASGKVIAAVAARPSRPFAGNRTDVRSDTTRRTRDVADRPNADSAHSSAGIDHQPLPRRDAARTDPAPSPSARLRGCPQQHRLRRQPVALSIAAVVNGALLSLFALAQYFELAARYGLLDLPFRRGSIWPIHLPQSLRLLRQRLRRPGRGAASELRDERRATKPPSPRRLVRFFFHFFAKTPQALGGDRPGADAGAIAVSLSRGRFFGLNRRRDYLPDLGLTSVASLRPTGAAVRCRGCDLRPGELVRR